MRLLRFEAWPLTFHILAWSLAPLAVLLLAVAFALTAYTRLEGASSRLTSTYQILDQTAKVARRVVDMETGMRGYALSADPSFLEPYEEARAELPALLASLRALVADQPEQLGRLDTVETVLTDWDQNVAMRVIARVQAGEDVRPTIRSASGKQRIDRIRAELDAFDAAEEHVLTERAAAAESSWRVAGLMLAATLTAMALAATAGVWGGRRVARGIQTFAAAADEIAAGHLTIRLPTDGASEFAATGRAINRLATSLDAAAEEVAAQHEMLVEQAHEAERLRGEARATLDAAAEAMLLVGPDRRFQAVNRRFEDVFGVDGGQVLGRRFEELDALVDQVFAQPDAVRARLSGTASDQESRFTELIEQRWPVHRELQAFTTPVHSEGGEYLGRLYVFRDVTREREVDRLKTEFISLVSHELRTPLTSIKGYLDLLLEEELGPIAPAVREPLETIRGSADRISRLVNDLLDVSRIDDGTLEMSASPTDLRRLIQVAAQSVRPQIEAKQQAISVEVPDDLPLALTDPTRTTHVLLRLLSNANNYTPDGGRIAVRARPQDGVVRIDVSDTGIGIDARDQERLFTRFFRGQNRATRAVPGTGLGLAISRSLVETLGGQITVDSEPGRGSTFSLTLPRADAAVRC